MGQRWTFAGADQLKHFNEFVSQQMLAGKTPTVEFVSEKRNLDQNSLIRVLYRKISAAVEDMSLVDVIRFCKLHFGVPILRSDSEKFRGMYDKVIKRHDHETKLLMMDYLPVTSTMTKEQASEYIDSIIEHYSKAGIYIDLERDHA